MKNEDNTIFHEECLKDASVIRLIDGTEYKTDDGTEDKRHFAITSFNMFGETVFFTNEDTGFGPVFNSMLFKTEEEADEFLESLKGTIDLDVYNRHYFDTYAGGELFCGSLLKSELHLIRDKAERIGVVTYKPSLSHQGGCETYCTTALF